MDSLRVIPAGILENGNDDGDQEGLHNGQDSVDGTGVPQDNGADAEGGAEKEDEKAKETEKEEEGLKTTTKKRKIY